MKFKKGFTLAELTIVIMVIGVIATLAIPMMMKGIMEAQVKEGYKKAFNAVANVVGKEYVGGTLPGRRNAQTSTRLFATLANSLQIREIIVQNGIDDGIIPIPDDNTIKYGLNITSGDVTAHIGLTGEDQNTEGFAPGVEQLSSWVISDDSIGYAMILSGDDNEFCPSKAEILSKTSSDEAVKAACSIIVVDTNGMWKGPNRLEKQVTSAGTSDAKADSIANKDTKMVTLTRDRYYIYIGSDGATAGPSDVTVSGRIINDLK